MGNLNLLVIGLTHSGVFLISDFYQSAEYQAIVAGATAQAHHDFWGAALFITMLIATTIWAAKTGEL